MLIINNSNANADFLMLGNQECFLAYLGEDIVYYKQQIDDFITFTASEPSTLGLSRLSSVQSVWYSTDKRTWTPFTTSDTISLATGQSVYVRGIQSGAPGYSNYTQFAMTGKIACSGDIRKFFDYTQSDPALYNYAGYRLFYDCVSLTAAPELPAATLSEFCYSYMFGYCTSLTTAPELPATALASDCYSRMFFGCTGLTTAPSLPATTMVANCYSYMFRNCIGLTTAPSLPATRLASNCYGYMFQGCTGLTAAPELPATALPSYCYTYMFRDCTSLITGPSVIPATSIGLNCCYAMFQGCTNLALAPRLTYNGEFGTTACYSYMFNGCSNLSYIYCLGYPSASSAQGGTTNWVTGVEEIGTFVTPAATQSRYYRGTSGIPTGWTIQNA